MTEERPAYSRERRGAPQGNTNAQKGDAPRKRWMARLNPETIAKIERLARERGISQGVLIDKLIEEIAE